ncbi:MAG: hypothetical protein KGJ02_07545 [Verrucomicrobiota bacterium]|nr:hypothetical protein [Verrucomicrobiota bacterium]
MLILALFILAAEILDHEMTSQEKKETGVYKLSDKQKAALQEWIDIHYEKRQTPLATRSPHKNRPTLSESLLNGSYIRLSDGSLWNVRPQDTPFTQSWINAVEIIISPSNDKEYPYKLTNSLTGTSIYARKADHLPSK